MQPGEPDRPAQKRGVCPDDPGGQSGQQLGLHGHGQPGLESEGLGRALGTHDAPACPEASGRKADPVADGVSDVLRGPDRDALPDRPGQPSLGVSPFVLEPMAGSLPEARGAASWRLAVLSLANSKPGSGRPGPYGPSNDESGVEQVGERKAAGQPSVRLGFGDAPCLRHSPSMGNRGLYYACFGSKSNGR